MKGTVYGYVRVSTQEQNEARQLSAMREFGVEEKYIVTEKRSGKDFNRPRYRHLVNCLRPDDVLVVKNIDRLGRNYEEILEQWSVSAPVIKCKKTPRKKCRFVAERREKR